MTTTIASRSETQIDAPYEVRFRASVDRQIEWFKSRADLARSVHNAFRILLILLGAILPALTTNDFSALSGVAAVTIAALTGLDAHFKPGQQWRHYRSTQLSLERLRSSYDYAIRKDLDPEALQTFHGSVMRLLELEEDQFWGFRMASKPEEKPQDDPKQADQVENGRTPNG